MTGECGVPVPRMRLGFGGVGLGSASGAGWRHDVHLVEEAVDRGVTVFDTADAYGAGASERVLGRALRRRRADVVIATKAGYRFRERSLVEQSLRRAAGRVLEGVRATRQPSGGAGGSGGEGGGYRDQDFSAPYLHQAVDASLRRLGTEYVDVLQLHGPPSVMPAVIDQLQDLVVSGKVRKLGVGAESVTVAADWLAVDGLGVVQLPFGLLDPEAAQVVLPRAPGSPVELWARGVLGGGLLKAAGRGAAARADPKWPVISDLLGLSQRTGLPLDELAVGFVRAHAAVSTVLVGISTRQHLRRNLELIDAPPLDADLVAEIWKLLTGDEHG
jgi:aryl-alcohol dehydrogenase-like predicted oxidoreductase